MSQISENVILSDQKKVFLQKIQDIFSISMDTKCLGMYCSLKDLELQINLQHFLD